MSTLKEIVQRHGWDRWKDAAFIGVAVLMTALAIGSVTTKAAGTASPHSWNGSVTVMDGNLDQAR